MGFYSGIAYLYTNIHSDTRFAPVFSDPTGVLHLTLYDPSDSQVGKVEACLNVDLCKEGHALLDKRLPYWNSAVTMKKALEEAHQEARRKHRGIFELGDPTGDE